MMAQTFYSTKGPGHFVGLKEAVLRSLPADNGLYMPREIRELPGRFWEEWRGLSFADLGYEVVRHFFQGAMPEGTLCELVHGAIDFDAPVVPLDEGTSVLELFHGPTLAFKDFGARFMARLMGWLTREDDEPLTVLVATSGDTGGAVASAFHGVEGTRVVILYPSGKVSGLQEKQLTTLGDNITALEVRGTFDDCQRLVKSAFLDGELSRGLNLTSANSINISRLIPQSFYYFHAVRQLAADREVVFVVPSGNFGNLTAGLLASRMGLPVRHFVAATNVNDVVPQYLRSGRYEPRASVQTISNAMDVGAPSNFARMERLFSELGAPWEGMRKDITGYAFDDERTREAIREVAERHDYLLDPHGAVGWLAAKCFQREGAGAGSPAHHVVLGTAHPIKFLPVLEEAMPAESLQNLLETPPQVVDLLEREKVATLMEADEAEFHEWLRRHLG